jgi:hypothetical protein
MHQETAATAGMLRPASSWRQAHRPCKVSAAWGRCAYVDRLLSTDTPEPLRDWSDALLLLHGRIVPPRPFTRIPLRHVIHIGEIGQPIQLPRRLGIDPIESERVDSVKGTATRVFKRVRRKRKVIVVTVHVHEESGKT